ncbi:MAG: heme lyase CcmF/NrfE family subunit [Chloroflexota bacterium]
MTDIGYIAALLAFVVAVYAAAAGVLGVRDGFPELVRSARRGVYAVFALTTLAEGVLVYSLLTLDFGLRYVAEHASRDMAAPYLVSAIYAGNDGSLLFWVWILSGLATVLAWRYRHERSLAPYVSAVNMGVSAFFLLLVTLVASPFERLATAPADGNGLNPMLENIGMLIHPPTLYLGYVGLTVPFAFAIAALLTGRLDETWVVRSRMWALFAWLMLGIGNILGGQWAYVELGWGGYWAWDPVENASLMPWLIITAYLHANVVRRRRDMFKTWSMVLAATAFLLSIFGTFVTRSGIISSVHAFGESSLGPFFVTFMGASILLAFGLIFYRTDDLRGEDQIEGFWSRENWVFITNLILVGCTVAVFFGTIYPAISELATGRKVELGKDFYNQVNGPILLALVLALGICPILGWRSSRRSTLMVGLVYPAVAAVGTMVVLLALGMRQYVAVLAFGVCAFVVFVYAVDWFRAVRARQRSLKQNPLSAFAGMIAGNRRRYGAHIVHLSIAVMTIGVVGSTFFVSSVEGNLKVGETLTAGNYTIRYEGMAQDGTPSRDIVSATVTLMENGQSVARMEPQSIFHKSLEQPVSEVAIRTTAREDVYVILAGWTQDSTATFRVLINPLVVWIWIGGVLFLVGGLVAMWPQARSQEAVVGDDTLEIAPSAVRVA